MSQLRAIGKLSLLIPHIVWGIFSIYVIFPTQNQSQKNKRIEAWAGALLAKLAIQLVVKGAPPAAGPMLLVSNHISWLDILVMHASKHCRFVSKADVKHWPVLGALATGAGTLYIERESRRDAMRVVHHMCEALQNGDILAVFPEGTTGNGVDLLPFHANLLQAPIVCKIPVQPLALKYLDPQSGKTSQAMSYVGDESLFESLWGTLKAKGVVAHVTYGEPQSSNDRSRRMWSDDLRGEIERLKAD
jgi:1-acyl-sn-glycerol-3-phosphate acyltransferase